MDQAILLQMVQQAQHANAMNLFPAKSNHSSNDGGEKFQQLLDSAVQQEPKTVERPEQPGGTAKPKESDGEQAEQPQERARDKFTGLEPVWFQPLIYPKIVNEEMVPEAVPAEEVGEAADNVVAIGPNVVPLVNPRLTEPSSGLLDLSSLVDAEEESSDPSQDKVIASVTVEREQAERMTATAPPITIGQFDSGRFGELIREAKGQLLRTVGITSDEDEENGEVLFSEPSVTAEKVERSTGTALTLDKLEDVTDTAMLRAVRQREGKPTEERADHTPFGQVESLLNREIEQPQPLQQAPVLRAPQMEQIRVAVTENLENGRMEFQMELNPRELGRIDVKMIVESGKLSVEIMAQTPRTEQLLRSSLDGLANSLRTVSSQELSSVQVVSSTNSAETQFGAAFAMNQHNPGTAQQQADTGKTNSRKVGGVSTEAATAAQEESNTPQRLLDYAV